MACGQGDTAALPILTGRWKPLESVGVAELGGQSGVEGGVGVQRSLQVGKVSGQKQLDVSPKSGLIFVHAIFCPKRKIFTFSRAHSHVLTNATRRQEYFRADFCQCQEF